MDSLDVNKLQLSLNGQVYTATQMIICNASGYAGFMGPTEGPIWQAIQGLVDRDLLKLISWNRVRQHPAVEELVRLRVFEITPRCINIIKDMELVQFRINREPDAFGVIAVLVWPIIAPGTEPPIVLIIPEDAPANVLDRREAAAKAAYPAAGSLT